jgi:alpha,alpha-trehalase
MKGLLLIILISWSHCIFASTELNQLLNRFDFDRDKKITIDDKIPVEAFFIFQGTKVQGVYELSNLTQELKLSEITKSKVNLGHVKENPVDRISRSIREIYWDGLTRQIDPSTLNQVLPDPKIQNNKPSLFVPFHDQATLEFYQSKKIKVTRLPEVIKPGYVASLKNHQGLLSLGLKDGKGIPYVVPGGRFNEMYGWDSYFHILGTLADNRIDLAKSMVDNFVYEINHYGKILNANRTYYLTRSQPPFFTSMVREVYKVTKDKEWLRTCLKAAIKEYQEVWLHADRVTPLGLNRYAGFDQGIPPEVELGHFDEFLKPIAVKYKKTIPQLITAFNENQIRDPVMKEFFLQDRAVRESGHDTTYRWRVANEDRATDFVTIDLNALLYKYELDIALLIKNEFNDHFESFSGQTFIDLAQKRKTLIRKYLWNEERSIFFDYNWKSGLQSKYVSATTFFALWATTQHDSQFKLLSKAESVAFIKNALNKLEEAGGLAATAKESLEGVKVRSVERQWDYPNGWAPHQILAWEGLIDYGFEDEANRLIYKWLLMITKNAMNYNGTIPEKFNVVTQSHKVFAEYGNVGTKFSYITMEGFGWMNASYQYGLKKLPWQSKEKLRNAVSVGK